MEKIPQCEYNYPNKLARIAFDSVEDVVGKNGLNIVLKTAQIPEFINNYPPENMERGVNFADFSAMMYGLEEVFGARGGRTLGLRSGKAAFKGVLSKFGEQLTAGVPDYAALSMKNRFMIGFTHLADVLGAGSSKKSTVQEDGDDIVYTTFLCPLCWGRHDSDHPVCDLMVGLLQEAAKTLSGGQNFKVVETRCQAMNDEVCEYHISTTPME